EVDEAAGVGGGTQGGDVEDVAGEALGADVHRTDGVAGDRVGGARIQGAQGHVDGLAGGEALGADAEDRACGGRVRGERDERAGDVDAARAVQGRLVRIRVS